MNNSGFPASLEGRDVPAPGRADLAIFPGNWTAASHLLLLQTIERQTPAPKAAAGRSSTISRKISRNLCRRITSSYCFAFSPDREHPGDGSVLTKSVKSGNLPAKAGDRVDAGLAWELENED
jgi:hypothetical protein